MLSFPGRYTHHILVPSLVKVFGVPFGVSLIAVLFGLVIAMRSVKGVVAVAFFTGVGMLLAYWGMSWSLGCKSISVEGFTTARHVVVSGACIGAVGTGIGLLKEWFVRM